MCRIYPAASNRYGLTLTQDVFKYNKNIWNVTYPTGLTLTQDVFKLRVTKNLAILMKSLTLT